MKGRVGELDEENSLSGSRIYGHPAFRISLRYIDQLGIITQCDGVDKRLLMLFTIYVIAHWPFSLQAVSQSLILVVWDKCEVIIFDPWYFFGHHIHISVETCHRQRHVSRIVVKNCRNRIVSWTKTPKNLLSRRITSYCWAPSYFLDHQTLDRQYDLDHYMSYLNLFRDSSSAPEIILIILLEPRFLFWSNQLIWERLPTP